MFTGLIESTAVLSALTDTGLTVSAPDGWDDVSVGDSICVSGVCLTVVDLSNGYRFDVVPETWKKTTLSSLSIGDAVNLERALPVNGRLGGHIVQGHVDGVARVDRVEVLSDGSKKVALVLPAQLVSSVVSKGSIAVDGVSLTVADIDDNRLTIALIPKTLTETTLDTLSEGDEVNIETDVLARYATKSY